MISVEILDGTSIKETANLRIICEKNYIFHLNHCYLSDFSWVLCLGLSHKIPERTCLIFHNHLILFVIWRILASSGNYSRVFLRR